MFADIHILNAVPFQIRQLGFCEPITTGAGNAENIDIVIEISCVRLSVFLQNIRGVQIFANFFEYRNTTCIFLLCPFEIRLKPTPFFTDNGKCRFHITGVIFPYDSEITEKATDFLFQHPVQFFLLQDAGIFTQFLILLFGFVDSARKLIVFCKRILFLF